MGNEKNVNQHSLFFAFFGVAFYNEIIEHQQKALFISLFIASVVQTAFRARSVTAAGPLWASERLPRAVWVGKED